MGRFGITARVVDSDGDAGEIVDKRKGERLVRYDRMDCGLQWMAKSGLTVEAWVPKVGDRVRNIGEYSYGADFPLGGEGIVSEAADNGAAWAVSDATGWRGFFFKSEIEPAEPLPVAEQPAGTTDETTPTTWAPVAGKFGKTRDGRKVGPMRKWDSEKFDCADEGEEGTFLWHADGRGLENADLISEWPAEVAVAPATATPFTLEAGKFYETATGKRSGPMQIWAHHVAHPFEDENGYIYKADGTSEYGGATLVKEVPAAHTLTIGATVTLSAPAKITGFHASNANLVLANGGSFNLPVASLVAA